MSMAAERWRLLTDPHDAIVEPLTAAEIVERLWAGRDKLRWAEAVDGGAGAFPQDVPSVRAILLRDRPRIARSWLQHEYRPEWVFGWVHGLVQHDPSQAWPLLVALVAGARDDEELAGVAAGPIEDFLKYHGPDVIAKVEAEAKANPAWRRALSLVWRSTIDADVWRRVVVVADRIDDR